MGGPIRTKRVYDRSDQSDGTRILVDRLWPRGLKKEDANVDVWMKELAPSHELRRWFKHGEGQWQEFRRRYEEELAAPESRRLLGEIAHRSLDGNVTLVYASRDTERNNAVVVQELASQVARKTR